MQQINFTRNLERKENTTMFLIFKEVHIVNKFREFILALVQNK